MQMNEQTNQEFSFVFFVGFIFKLYCFFFIIRRQQKNVDNGYVCMDADDELYLK